MISAEKIRDRLLMHGVQPYQVVNGIAIQAGFQISRTEYANTACIFISHHCVGGYDQNAVHREIARYRDILLDWLESEGAQRISPKEAAYIECYEDIPGYYLIPVITGILTKEGLTRNPQKVPSKVLTFEQWFPNEEKYFAQCEESQA